MVELTRKKKKKKKKKKEVEDGLELFQTIYRHREWDDGHGWDVRPRRDSFDVSKREF